MLKAFQNLSAQAEGRYATDAELEFATDYANSYKMRLALYQKLKELEGTFVEEVHQKIVAGDANLLQLGTKDLTGKWKRDTMRVLRYSALAMLLDDAEIHGERLLYWFQTIMRAFNAQRSCDSTYAAMQTVAQQKLSSFESALFTPILELNRVSLGSNS